jgi:hypothetical protein
MENVKVEIDGVPEGGAVCLFHDTFLSYGASHVICADY